MVASDGDILSVTPEYITDYEFGVKAEMLDNRLRLNAGVFYYDYEDYQTNQLEPNSGTQVLSNLPEAEVYGLEAEVDFAVTERLYFNVGAGVTESEITETTDPSLEGNKLPLSEDFNFNWSVRYDLDTRLGRFTPQINGKYRGEYYTTKQNYEEIGGYAIWNANIAYESNDEKVYGNLWVKNIGDTVEPIMILDATEFFGADIAIINARRSYGVTVGYRF